ncbi:uncharacterized protein K489DRAFT_319943 [Dissoconium aciculare CBS 342.82]|uniref:Protein NO VEIN C-terminal domain-containing protein n=1 Tax=Dissoconium aciculare CBS 342.82 TaxID=1314786 RepID=A0A6J3M4I5_9PEZI|nr:uncharacterized protein K489DRAFT_319943 [Dissoconium aciculare CBS 342.82]KAF1822941.1 hypothetical protein K489DRAFT_319943 [Dissoconium aciculare CBS 342.82]
MANKDQAKAIIEQIAEERGYLDEAFMATLDPDKRPRIERALYHSARLASVSITALAKNLYSSDARFVFELLQNADDNKFTRATARGEAPFVSFHCRDDRVVIECNEDGFTKKDINAISSVGESSKSGLHGYIGAKGIGFKSVFIAAWKVHIQSGHYSFFFEHMPESKALGMITPIWAEPEENLADSVTRITLYLHKDGDAGKLKRLRNTIDKQLSSLQQTCLLFLQKLKRIEITFYDQDGVVTNYNVLRVSDVTDHGISLETAHGPSLGPKVSQTQRYHVTKYLARDVARSENRETTLEQASAETEVILAFPLSAKNEPLVDDNGSRKDLFAFLPIRESDFDFIVHADFDTTANRQDINEDSLRNIGLRNEIAAAFLQAAYEFCEDDDLRCTWPLFLPSRKRCSKFWLPMLQKIEDLMENAKLIRSRLMNEFKSIKDVMILDDQFRDDRGEPLLGRQDSFISDSYGKAHLTRLKLYGLQKMNEQRFMALLREDLSSIFSKMQGYLTSASWHSKVARLLEDMYTGLKYTELERMDLLPLTSGTFVAMSQGPVYLPTTRGISIPSHLGLSTLDPNAVRNEDRLSFFSALMGRSSMEAPISEVKTLILKRYRSQTGNVTLTESKVDLHYLYLVHPLIDSPDRQLANIKMYERSMRYVAPTAEDVYYPNDHPYGPEMLLECPDGCMKFSISLLLGLLENLWKHEGDFIKANPPLKAALVDTAAPVLDHCAGFSGKKLSNVYLPVPKLCELSAKYLEPEEDFVFLQIPDARIGHRLDPKWSFLHEELGVKAEDDWNFYRLLLLSLTNLNSNPERMTRIQRVFDLYAAIYAKVIQNGPHPPFLSKLQETACILVLDEDGQPREWARSGLCVWDGPQEMDSKRPLRRGYEAFLRGDQFDHVFNFFSKSLKIGDADCATILIELQSLKREGTSLPVSEVFCIYDYLMDQAFEEHGLIYAGNSKWHKTSECLWSRTTELQHKVNLNKHYEDLEDFFVEVVDVRTLTTQMAVDELCATNSESTIDQVKNAIWTLNSLAQVNETPIDYSVLHDKAIFVVVEPDGQKSLKSLATAFSIADREHLSNKFFGKIKLLDYSVDEIRRLDTFLTCLGLRGRFLSATVKVFTTMTGNTHREISSPERALTFKAHAILRHAGTFQSPRYSQDMSALYQTLQTARILATDGLRSELRISQDGPVVVAEATSGDIHIVEEGLKLIVYVPLDRKQQALCFADVFPVALEDWLMRDPMTNIREDVSLESVSALAAILAVSPFVVGDILDRRGIVNVPIENSDPDPPEDLYSRETESGEEGDYLTADTHASTERAESELTPDNTTNPVFSGAILTESAESDLIPGDATNSVFSETFRGEETVRQYSFDARRSSQRPMQGPVTTTIHDANTREDRLYRAILERVVTSARVAGFPSKGAFSMSALLASLPGLEDINTATTSHSTETYERFRSSSQLERDFKIGAAGELYVFELLERLNLSCWSQGRNNWQSKIRGRVRLHPDYADIEDWPGGRETADIVYSDARGDFTNLLIDSGYLERQRWSGATPEYFIEVKTTTSDCQTPFYMSKFQYKRMKDIHDSDQTRKVYLVCRVFGLAMDHIGMTVYLDPEQMRLDGSLIFTGETWSVVPGV